MDVIEDDFLIYERMKVDISADEINHIIYLFIRNTNAKVILPSQFFVGLCDESTYRSDDAVTHGNH